jgi:hypothetical protein
LVGQGVSLCLNGLRLPHPEVAVRLPEAAQARIYLYAALQVGQPTGLGVNGGGLPDLNLPGGNVLQDPAMLGGQLMRVGVHERAVAAEDALALYAEDVARQDWKCRSCSSYNVPEVSQRHGHAPRWQ